ncbi:MAG: hypothetical protein ACI9N9_001591 [Enterobacterales bacterium]|jgi:hypothetical protein
MILANQILKLIPRNVIAKLGILGLSFVLYSCGSGGETSTPTVPPTPEPEPVTADLREPSVARLWNEVLLEAIRKDFARPTIHARNLFHISSAVYDAWANYSTTADLYLLGNQLGDFQCTFDPPTVPTDIHLAREEAISYAAYRLINHRFRNSPRFSTISNLADTLMSSLSYSTETTSTNYQGGSAAELGNYIAECYINYGLQDGANEENDYGNISYMPVNPSIDPNLPGNPNIVDPDRWQPISLPLFIDQSGNVLSSEIEFLSPEWGKVKAFSLKEADKTTYQRDGFDYHVYFDPGPPAYSEGALSEYYKWGFSMVSIWSSHLDPSDGVMIDISPVSLGSAENASIDYYPASIAEYSNFYDILDGGDPSTGYTLNPATGLPYETQLVPRGDYTRVLAEFWADGPDSETPPGHWFVVLNEVNDHPLLEKRYAGEGPVLGPLEWDVKAYFALAGAMHDSAIAAWGIKGWYDYTRPLSAIRAMADKGQSSDPLLPSYSPGGITLFENFIELVEPGDRLEGEAGVNVGKIKLKSWQGPSYVLDPEVDTAGVDWILAENWWPYQRPSFVTPPFAGYVSGHSVYSRAAAEILTLLTGNEYFPGGMSNFVVPANDFLVFEQGPSVEITLQWATYRDASDQCSLSRIWGGIHPPVDDIPGRLIGMKIGPAAFNLATGYFAGNP